ncbi:fumarylacetoacetate hydrolase family protein [Nocardia mexicana]|uniref:2-keto-4-pentenoate hydratase/2-oxohepta-3-ene-1,7-dioic acid hydratase in catechol pathway n=1 Tax=Nocardia mexicana TaxID=279262 RepID=A0A370H5K3_9NOCA|nr:fumarylacetoacetate hydrolase family protein [Nocardia mexicana]RDI51656.1 2-keto-4-pentenoate hydratase/2-oxohepta-3-ene-1,7-dioic acid hydratase in catechol pathway [Nocardia mexicana]
MTPHAFTADFEIARYDTLGLADGATVLPVCPVSFRDFMIFEKHAVDAARGLAKRFVPAGYRVARAYEALTRRTFPAFRPHPLWYRQPIYYMSNALTIVPSGVPIAAPSYSRALDFELELGVVLGEPLRDATVEQAAAAIAAVVVVNDFSARDKQLAEMRSGFGPQRSKHFATSMSATAVAGPAIADRLDSLTATVSVNGNVVSRTGTHAMRYSMAEAIAHVSRGEQLYPGELLSSGTLPGGSGMELGRWPVSGDDLRLEIDGIGVIEHRIL